MSAFVDGIDQCVVEWCVHDYLPKKNSEKEIPTVETKLEFTIRVELWLEIQKICLDYGEKKIWSISIVLVVVRKLHHPPPKKKKKMHKICLCRMRHRS